MTNKGDLMSRNEDGKLNVTTAVPVLQSASQQRVFGITPVQQLISSGTGAIITSLLGEH